jgi:hypothetical protein
MEECSPGVMDHLDLRLVVEMAGIVDLANLNGYVIMKFILFLFLQFYTRHGSFSP